MPSYAWSCLACSESNPPTADACGRCNCPAEASGARIEAARDAWRQRAGLPLLGSSDPFALLAQLPLLAIGGTLLSLLGAAMLIVDMGASTTAFGGLMIALAALCANARREPMAPIALG